MVLLSCKTFLSQKSLFKLYNKKILSTIKQKWPTKTEEVLVQHDNIPVHFKKNHYVWKHYSKENSWNIKLAK